MRLNNLLKRQNTPKEEVTFGPYRYSIQTGLLKKGNKTILLTTAEQALLTLFINHLNQDISREQLAAWLNVDNTRTIDVQVTRLRKKLETDTQSHCLQTIRGKGYRLVST